MLNNVFIVETTKKTFYTSFYILIRKSHCCAWRGSVIIGCDFNSHVGKESDGFENPHGFGYGRRNLGRIRLQHSCVANNLTMANTFKKSDNQLIKYSAEGNATQIPEVSHPEVFCKKRCSEACNF